MTPPPNEYDVYISFNQKDAEAAKHIAGRLRDSGLRVWLFDWYVSGGEDWRAQMKEALARSASAAVFYGPAGLGVIQSEEVLFDILAREKESGGAFRVIPVLLPEGDENNLPPVLRARLWVDFRNGLDDEKAFAALRDAVLAAAAGEPASKPAAAGEPETPREGGEKPSGEALEEEGSVAAAPREQEPSAHDRLSADGRDALALAGTMALSAKRPMDSTLYLAALLSSAPRNLKHAGYSFLLALQAQRPSPKSTTAEPDVIDLLKLTEYDLIEIPRERHVDSLLVSFSKDLDALVSKAGELALATSSANGTVRVRHLIGAILAPSAPDGAFSATRRLKEMSYDLGQLRSSVLSHIREYHSGSYDEWQRILLPGGVEDGEEPPAVTPSADLETPPEEPAAEEEAGEESIRRASVSDQPSARDTLGFAPYVKAIATFLMNEQTRPPLTLSIEGEWGSGKSSFMLQLAEELRAISDGRRREAAAARREETRRLQMLVPMPEFGLLDRLQTRLLIRRDARRLRCPTVEFNAWRHDKENALWASFALEFVRKLSQNMGPAERLRAHFKLLLRRFRWRDGWLILLRMVFLLLLLGALSWALVGLFMADGAAIVKAAAGGDKDAAALSGVVKASGIAGYFAAFIFFISKLREFVGNPFAFDLRRYVESPDYEGNVAFIEQFHEDFKKIVATYAGDNKVFVFIDDLDRCEVPKAADLMQAINLMISVGAPQLVFVIGMDREKVAAGLAVKNEKLLPYLAHRPTKPADGGGAQGAGPAAAPKSGPDTAFGLEYGYNFIEKFIQIPFRVPQPAPMGVRALLDFIDPLVEVAGDGVAGARPTRAQAPQRRADEEEVARLVREHLVAVEEPTGDAPAAPRSNGGRAPAWAGPTQDGRDDFNILREAGARIEFVDADEKGPGEDDAEERAGLLLLEKGDSLTVRNIVLMAAPALDYNPRRIKQFINLFRLQAYIAHETGLFRTPPTDSPYGQLTLEQLGKFVAIGLRWPRLLADFDEERTLPAELQRLAADREAESGSQAANNWRLRPELMTLLRFGSEGGSDPFDRRRPADPRRYSLAALDVDSLLQVTPPVRRDRPAEPRAVASRVGAG